MAAEALGRCRLTTVPSTADDTGQDRGGGPRSLRALREAAGLNQIEVVERVKRALPEARFSQAALSRVERSKGRLTPDVVRVLCDIYNVTGDERAALLQRAKTRRPGTWTPGWFSRPATP